MPVPAGERPDSTEDLLALLSTATSGVILVFTLVLYAHYYHLHTPPNHLLVGVALLASLLGNISLFLGIFAFPDADSRFSTAHCRSFGAIDIFFNAAVIASVWVCWISHAATVLQWPLLAVTTNRQAFIVAIGAGVLATVVVALETGTDSVGQGHTPGCGDMGAPIIIVKLLALLLTCVPACVALFLPLFSSRVNATQRFLLLRRFACHLSWVSLEVYCCAASLAGGMGNRYAQSFLDPFTGAVLAITFLYSERMLTLRALGLPPGVDPPYGFTAAMHFIPEKLGYDEAYLTPTDATASHGIRY